MNIYTQHIKKMRVSLLLIFRILYFFNIYGIISAWDNDELEVFDVVEEVNQNFYEILGVPQVFFFFSIVFIYAINFCIKKNDL